MSVQTNIVVTHGAETIGTIKGKYYKDTTLPHEECVAIQNLFGALSTNQRTASFTAQVTSGDQATASGTDTFSGHASVSDTFLINGVTFTGVASSPSNNQFVIGANGAGSASGLASAINASTTALIAGYVTASAATSVCTITAVASGTTGNTITIAKGTDVASVQTVSGARLTGGAAPTTVYGPTTYHCGK